MQSEQQFKRTRCDCLKCCAFLSSNTKPHCERGQIFGKEEVRPPRWKDGLARSFLHCSRPSQYVLPLGISLAMELKERGRSVWLVGTWGHDVQGCG